MRIPIGFLLIIFFYFFELTVTVLYVNESGQNLTRHRPQLSELYMIFIVSFLASFNVHLLGLKNCYWTAAALEPLVVGLCAQQVILSSSLSPTLKMAIMVREC